MSGVALTNMLSEHAQRVQCTEGCQADTYRHAGCWQHTLIYRQACHSRCCTLTLFTLPTGTWFAAGPRPSTLLFPKLYGPILSVYRNSTTTCSDGQHFADSAALMFEYTRWVAGKLEDLYWDAEFIKQSVWYWIDVAFFYDRNTTQQVGGRTVCDNLKRVLRKI
jgi:hypothetical protein